MTYPFFIKNTVFCQ